MKSLKFIALLLIITSCSQKIDDDSIINTTVSEKLLNGRFDAYNSTQHCDCSELSQDTLYTFFKNDSLFTGVCSSTYPNSSAIMEEKQIYKGKLHGNYRIFSRDGDTLTASLYRNGSLQSDENTIPSVCSCKELQEEPKSSKDGLTLKTYEGTPYSGVCKKYYPGLDSAQVYMTISYKDGLTEGEMIIYNKEGSPMMIQQYEKGVELNQVTFSN